MKFEKTAKESKGTIYTAIVQAEATSNDRSATGIIPVQYTSTIHLIGRTWFCMTYIRAYDLQRNEPKALLYCQELGQAIESPDVSQEPKYAPYVVLGKVMSVLIIPCYLKC